MSRFQKGTTPRVRHIWQSPDLYGNIFFAYYFSELKEVYIGINTKEKFLAYRHFGP